MNTKWINFEEDGWGIVIPETDSKPHSNQKGEKRDIADIDCPCKPKVDWVNQTIVHNSFEHMKMIQDSMREK